MAGPPCPAVPFDTEVKRRLWSGRVVRGAEHQGEHLQLQFLPCDGGGDVATATRVMVRVRDVPHARSGTVSRTWISPISPARVATARTPWINRLRTIRRVPHVIGEPSSSRESASIDRRLTKRCRGPACRRAADLGRLPAKILHGMAACCSVELGGVPSATKHSRSTDASRCHP